MSNSYCSTELFTHYFDNRTIAQLSNDADSDVPDTGRITTALDTAANEMESYLSGIYATPILATTGIAPLVLTRWVSVQALRILYMRRSKFPDSLNEEIKRGMEWIQDVSHRRAIIPGLNPTSKPVLQASESLKGRSRFSPGAAFFDRKTSPTAPDGRSTT